MKIAEVAKNYGVPMPETCKKLNWNKETLLCWVKFEDDNEEWLAVVTNGIICASIENVDNFVLIGGDNRLYNAGLCDIEYIIPAPQFHEIKRELPNNIVKSHDVFSFLHDFESICYEGKNDILFIEEILSAGIGDAIANVYISYKGKEYADIVIYKTLNNI